MHNNKLIKFNKVDYNKKDKNKVLILITKNEGIEINKTKDKKIKITCPECNLDFEIYKKWMTTINTCICPYCESVLKFPLC